MKDLPKYIPTTATIVSYFFICGGLYLIGYWSTFNIDISNIVSFTDIPKSFVMPFVFSFGALVLSQIISFLNTPNHIYTQSLFSYLKTDDVSTYDSTATGLYTVPIYRTYNTKRKRLRFKIFKRIFSSDTFTFLTFVGVVIFYTSSKNSALYWMVSSYMLSVAFSLKISDTDVIKELIPNLFTRLYVLPMLIYTPFMSFGIGKANGVKVYSNIDIKYINTTTIKAALINNDTVSLKFLGVLGDKLIISSLDNKRILVLNQSAFDAVEIDSIKKGK